MFFLKVKDISKIFNERLIFKDISFDLKNGSSIAITGKNGAGKSTLLKIIAGLLSPTKGDLFFESNSLNVKYEYIFRYTGFVAPYLNLYNEFTALENLKILNNIRDIKYPDDKYIELLSEAGLFERRNDLLGVYSSGMKQRLKYAFAMCNAPELLLVDEPMSNLDEEGITFVEGIFSEQKSKGALILATNERSDLKYCDKIINLNYE